MDSWLGSEYMKSIQELIKVKEDTNSTTFEDLEKLKAETFNETEGNLNNIDGINCPICKNKGYIAEIENNSLTMKECKCNKRRAIIKKGIRSGLGDYLKKKFDDYIATEDWQKSIKQLAVDFCKNHSKDSTWYVMTGQSGSGKTLLCSIISNYLLYKEEQQVLYITWTDFISQLKRDMMGDRTNEVSDYLEELKNVDVLFIDELLKTYNNTDVKYIIEILNYRYNNDLKTILTSEKNIKELVDIDEATFGRVVEKSGQFIIDISRDRNKNYRLKNQNIKF